jgi:GNAT superfamily N-acetyltransferase
MAALPETGLVCVDPDDSDQIAALAELHRLTLPDSVPVRFGQRFMCGFYFPKLIRGGLAHADLFRCDGAWVGYTLHTSRPTTMLSEGVRRHFLFLCGLMPLVLLENPSALLAISKLLANRGGFPRLPRSGYLLTVGVHPDFRGRRVGEATIARQLVECANARLRSLGCLAVEATVDRANERALAFYRGCGFRVEDRGGGEQLQIRIELVPR